MHNRVTFMQVETELSVVHEGDHEHIYATFRSSCRSPRTSVRGGHAVRRDEAAPTLNDGLDERLPLAARRGTGGRFGEVEDLLVRATTCTSSAPLLARGGPVRTVGALPAHTTRRRLTRARASGRRRRRVHRVRPAWAAVRRVCGEIRELEVDEPLELPDGRPGRARAEAALRDAHVRVRAGIGRAGRGRDGAGPEAAQDLLVRAALARPLAHPPREVVRAPDLELHDARRARVCAAASAVAGGRTQEAVPRIWNV
jgi:hypothetical protein